MELTQTKKPNEKDNKKDNVFDSISANLDGRMEQISDFVLQKEEHLKRRSGTSGWSCYGQLYTKDQFREVSNGPTLENKF